MAFPLSFAFSVVVVVIVIVVIVIIVIIVIVVMIIVVMIIVIMVVIVIFVVVVVAMIIVIVFVTMILIIIVVAFAAAVVAATVVISAAAVVISASATIVVVIVVIVVAAGISTARVPAAVIVAAGTSAATLAAPSIPATVTTPASFARDIGIGDGPSDRRAGAAAGATYQALGGRIVSVAGRCCFEAAPAKTVGKFKQGPAVGRVRYCASRNADPFCDIKAGKERGLRPSCDFREGHAGRNQIDISLSAGREARNCRPDCRNTAAEGTGRTSIQNGLYEWRALLGKSACRQTDSSKGRAQKQNKGQFPHGVLHVANSQNEFAEDEIRDPHSHWITRIFMSPL
jgi:hypothetical protein